MKIPNLSIGRVFLKGLSRFHMTLFVVFIVFGLSTAVILINDQLNDPTIVDSYQSPINAGSIDQETLDRINALHRSNETLPSPLSESTRTNPFSE